MHTFLDDNFLLESKTAEELFHDFAKDMPIFDFHCHLPPKEVAENRNFASLTDVWLRGDHYKWRAMRACGVDEHSITGDASDEEKFMAWAATVPATIGNPLYQWTHLELKRYFGVDALLDPKSAQEIWKKCNKLVASPELRPRAIMEKFKVKVICTTDDPVDSLEYHRLVAADKTMKTKMLPAFRPDMAMAVENLENYADYLQRLEEASGQLIRRYGDLVAALDRRHQYFHENGCRLTDHAVYVPTAEDATESELDGILLKARRKQALSQIEIDKLRTALLAEIGRMNARRGWTMQLHIGALRDQNARMKRRLGANTGFDHMGDLPIAAPLSRFMDVLESEGLMPRTILYVMNPRDNDTIASLINTYQGGGIPGKIQFGSGWWYNDQKDGMERQMTALANMGLLARFVGMLTDSRSFLSYPRHEYFRRVLCNMIGKWVDNGEAPRDMQLLGDMVKDICFDNAKNYFGIKIGEAIVSTAP
jgi:glucuronate isomerase